MSSRSPLTIGTAVIFFVIVAATAVYEMGKAAGSIRAHPRILAQPIQ